MFGVRIFQNHRLLFSKWQNKTVDILTFAVCAFLAFTGSSESLRQRMTFNPSEDPEGAERTENRAEYGELLYMNTGGGIHPFGETFVHSTTPCMVK